MHIAFLTLFLGLVHGPQTVAVDPGAGVRAVEVLLDGRPVAKLERAPWSTAVDFGSPLLPHHLEARALGADGSQVGSAEQWVNLPRPPAEVAIVLESQGGARARTARLVWDHLTGEPPSEMHLSLDGTPLVLDPDAAARLELPTEGSAHVLSAELRWKSGAVARTDEVLTGDWGSEVATELTAVAVRTAKRRAAIAARDLQGALLGDGQPLRVTAVEQTAPEVFVIKTPGAERGLLGMEETTGARARQYGRFLPDWSLHFHFVSPVARRYQGAATAANVFDISQAITPRADASMVQLLRVISYGQPRRPEIADAVAAAAVDALAHRAPRAVLLITGSGDRPTPADLFTAAEVRAYLAAVGVPLYVWSFDKSDYRADNWGESEDISTPWGLRRAYDRLRDDVLAQQIVWVEGRRLPQSISMARAPAGTTAGEIALLTQAPR